MKKITIAIGVHRGQKNYFIQTLDSIILMLQKNNILEQTQIVVCNDQKQECNDYLIAKQYQNKYGNLFRLYNNNGNYGIAYTYHKMLLLAQGKFFIPFDSDDIIANFDINQSLDFLNVHDEYVGSYGIKRLFNNDCTSISDTGYTSDLFNFKFYCNHNCMILKTEELIKAGGYYPQFYKSNAIAAPDIVMWIGCYIYKDLKFQNQLRCYGRIHDNNSSEKNGNLYGIQFEKIKSCLINYFNEKKEIASDNLRIMYYSLFKQKYTNQDYNKLYNMSSKNILFNSYLFPYYVQYLLKNGSIKKAISSLLYGSLYNQNLKQIIIDQTINNPFIDKSNMNFSELKQKNKIVKFQNDIWFKLFL